MIIDIIYWYIRVYGSLLVQIGAALNLVYL